MIEIMPHGPTDADKAMTDNPFRSENGYSSQLNPIRLLLQETDKDGTPTFQFVISAKGKDCDGKISEIITS